MHPPWLYCRFLPLLITFSKYERRIAVLPSLVLSSGEIATPISWHCQFVAIFLYSTCWHVLWAIPPTNEPSLTVLLITKYYGHIYPIWEEEYNLDPVMNNARKGRVQAHSTQSNYLLRRRQNRRFCLNQGARLFVYIKNLVPRGTHSRRNRQATDLPK